MKTKYFLFFLCIATMLVSCKEDDNDQIPTVDNPEVVGSWFTICESEGTLPSSFTGTEDIPYTYIGYYYVLNNDKTGWCATLYFEDGAPEPIYIIGGQLAPFTYSSHSDGTVSLNFDNAYAPYAEIFKNWSARYGDSHIFITTDGQEIRLDRSDKEEKTMIESWVKASNGGSDVFTEAKNIIIENSGIRFSKSFPFNLNNNFFYGDSEKEIAGENNIGDYKINKSGSIDLEFKVCPIYLQSSNGSNAGDYYIVKCDVTPHNNSLWSPIKNNAIFFLKYRVYGYWFKDLELEVSLVNKDGTPINSNFINYYARPIPENANDSRGYTNGKTVSISGTINAGYSQKQGLNFGLGLSTSASWTSSTSYELTTINSTLDSSSPNKVKYTYESKNVNLSDDWDNIDKNFPAACRTEFTGHSFWVWHIPYDGTGTNGVKDGQGDDKQFRIKATVKAHYSSWFHMNNQDEGKRTDYDVSFDTGEGFLIPQPDRTPWGFIALKNATSYEMAHVKMYKKSESEPSLTVRGSFSKDQVAKGALPEGSYTVTYDLMNPNTNVVVSSWKIDNVTVHQGKDEESATVTYSTTDATKQ